MTNEEDPEKPIKYNPTNYGWVSEKSAPRNNHNVVVLIFDEFEQFYSEIIGYHEGGKWHLQNTPPNNYYICGWFPLPYTPDKN